MRKVEILSAEKKSLTQPQSEKLLMLTQEKKMALCEICGYFLIANDAAERVQSHVSGKQHVGYGMVRDFIAEFKAGEEKKKEEERCKQMEKEQDLRKSGSKDRDRFGEPSSGRDREREGDHHRDRSQKYESSHDRNDMGRRDGGRVDRGSRNGRDAARDRYRDRSRSGSPGRHGYKWASRSPSW